MTERCSPDSELLPCPFCGAAATLHCFASGDCIVCSECTAQTQLADEQEAIQFWNRRVAPAQTVTDAMIEAGARGITQSLADYDTGLTFDDMNEGQKQEARDVAKACLLAALSSTQRPEGE